MSGHCEFPYEDLDPPEADIEESVPDPTWLPTSENPLYKILSDAVIQICRAPKPAVAAHSWRFALGLKVTGSNHESIRRTARELGISPAWLSRCALQLQERYGLTAGAFNKPSKVRDTYRKTNGRGRVSSSPRCLAHAPEIRYLMNTYPDAVRELCTQLHAAHAGKFPSDFLERDDAIRTAALRLHGKSRILSFDDFAGRIERECARMYSDDHEPPPGKESLADA